MNRYNGFTLIELIVVIVLLGVLAAGAGMLITRPIEAYNDQLRRQQLVDSAEMALRKVAVDIRRALPNSIRLVNNSPNNWALEMVNTEDGARYRDEIDTIGSTYTSNDDILTFTDNDADFNVLGRFTNLAVPGTYNNRRLVIYNTSPDEIYAQAAAPTNPGVISSAGFSLSDTGEHHVRLNTPFQFAFRSPGQRLFVVDAPVSYTCDNSTGELNRYQGYDFSASQPVAAVEFQGAVNPGRVASQVSACTISYQPGSSQRSGLITLRLTLNDSAGESISLLHQVHVDNVP